MGLIFALFELASYQDVPFCQPQQLQRLNHGSTKAYLFPSFRSIPFSTAALGTICSMHAMSSVQDLGKCTGVSYIVLCLECCLKCWKHWKLNEGSDTPWSSNTPTFKSRTGTCTLTIKHSVFSTILGLIVEMFFMLFSIYVTVWWVENEWIRSIYTG